MTSTFLLFVFSLSSSPLFSLLLHLQLRNPLWPYESPMPWPHTNLIKMLYTYANALCSHRILVPLDMIWYSEWLLLRFSLEKVEPLLSHSHKTSNSTRETEINGEVPVLSTSHLSRLPFPGSSYSSRVHKPVTRVFPLISVLGSASRCLLQSYHSPVWYHQFWQVRPDIPT